MRVFGVSLDLEDERVDITVDLRSLACEKHRRPACYARAHRAGTAKEGSNVDEAANKALVVVEEMREMIEGVRSSLRHSRSGRRKGCCHGTGAVSGRSR